MNLTIDQMEELREVYDWGYFMEHVLKYKKDEGSYDLTDNEISLLIAAKDNFALFSDYIFESSPCETCGSHGRVSVNIGEKTFVIKQW